MDEGGMANEMLKQEDLPTSKDGGYQPIGGSEDTWGPRASDAPAPSQQCDGGGWTGALLDKAKGMASGIGDYARAGASAVGDMFSHYGK